MYESNGVREALERFYDISSELGPDIDMARAVGQQLVLSMPSANRYK